MDRKSGILMPIASLPSRFGVGAFGKETKQFIDIIKDGGFSLWQILPLNPLGYGHSPYQPFSSFALEELYIDLDDLADKGLIERVPSFNEDKTKIDYENIRIYKSKHLHDAFRAEMRRNPRCLTKFKQSHSWVEDWALFMMNKRLEGLKCWKDWKKNRKEMIGKPLPRSRTAKSRINYEIWLQMTLYRQWADIKRYANEKGIKIIGDIPFYVGYDSCDLWAEQKAFLLDKNKDPKFIAGCPPDYFSETGQRWGNPIYDWKYIENHDFDFFFKRLLKNGEIYDIIRLDHFRAFDTYWKVPSSCPTAIDGEWIYGPGYKIFDKFFEMNTGIEIIAEDLGELRPQVYVLRDHYDFPGMNVIEFTFEDENFKGKKSFNKENMVAYLGTHDNEPFKPFFASLKEETKAKWLKKLDELKIPEGSPCERFTHYLFSKKCNYAIISTADILALGNEARINSPGIIDDKNWCWKLKDYRDLKSAMPEMAKLNKLYNR
ncbi:MAG: 4-alpha-glucanotransferase [Bacilli bacterium]|nr:4-alpha-glucanotransferase [Bacilli bacterium]